MHVQLDLGDISQLKSDEVVAFKKSLNFGTFKVSEPVPCEPVPAEIMVVSSEQQFPFLDYAGGFK